MTLQAKLYKKNPITALFVTLIMAVGLVISSASVQAKPVLNSGPTFELIETINGHSLKGINKMIQSETGFLWLASTDGLLRFDGHDIKLFTLNKSNAKASPYNGVLDLLEDEGGTLWLVSYGGGLSRFDPLTETFTHFFHQSEDDTTLDSNKLTSLSHASGQKLWIGSEQGINLFDRKTLKNQRIELNFNALSHNESISSEFNERNKSTANLGVLAVAQDKNRQLWFSVRKQGLFKLNLANQQITAYVHNPNDNLSLNSNVVDNIHVTDKGTVWIGTTHGLNRFNPNQQNFTRFPIVNNASEKVQNSTSGTIFEDTLGRIWTANYYNGLNVLLPNSQNLKAFGQDSGRSQLINDILVDRSGVVWVADEVAGLKKLTTNAMSYEHWFAHKDESFFTLFTDAQGTTWMGTVTSLYALDKTTGQFNLKLANIGYVGDIDQLSPGKLLLGVSETGLVSFDTLTGLAEPFGSPAVLPTKNLHAQAVDEQGTVWVGMHLSSNQPTGLYSFNSQTKQYVEHLDQFTIETILPLSDQVIIGTRQNGLRILDKSSGQWSHLQDANKDISNVWSIYQDSKKRLWVATGNAGLAQLDLASRTLKFVTASLPSNDIRSIVEDQFGTLWLGTGKGMVRFNPLSGQTQSFGRDEGLRLDKMLSENSTLTTNGDILMSGQTQMIRFSPKLLSAQLETPPQNFGVMLSDFKLFNRSVNITTPSNPTQLSLAINNTETITLSHIDLWFSVTFASSNYNADNKLMYAYKMQGLTDRWVLADPESRTATFTSLPARDYTLKIKTSRPDGSWQEGYRALRITVKPPWWLTGQFFVAIIIFAFGDIYMLYRLRTRYLVKKAKELEQKVLERTATINRLMGQKERMFANISHEFKTPLTLILNPLESLLGDPEAKKFTPKVSMMKRNAQRLLRMVDQLLELSKLDTHKDDKQYYYQLNETLNMLLVSFEPLAKNKNLTIICPPFDDILLRLKTDALETILTNLLSNAIKYTPRNGQISINISTKDDYASIEIKDSGIGIDEENQKIVFKRFTRANENHDENIPGAGIGLALVKELIEDNQGSINLVSQLNIGSTFTITLPLSQQNNAQTQIIKGLSQSSQIEIETLAQRNEPLLAFTGSEHSELEKENQLEPALLTTILLIDDNADMLTLLVETLSQEYRCLTARTGEQGVKLALAQLPDLIISDVMMPGIDGYEVVKQLKHDNLTCHIPIILLTAKTDTQSRVKGWQEKADEYIEKPFNNIELRSRIENLLAIRALLRHRFQREFTESIPKSHEISTQFASQKSQFNPMYDVFLNQINQVLEQHYSNEKLDVGFLASELAMSHRQLSRKMKSVLDFSAIEAIRSFRLTKAAELLCQGVSASMVSHQVGFTSHSYFSQCFKAQYNCMPSNYANQVKQCK